MLGIEKRKGSDVLDNTLPGPSAPFGLLSLASTPRPPPDVEARPVGGELVRSGREPEPISVGHGRGTPGSPCGSGKWIGPREENSFLRGHIALDWSALRAGFDAIRLERLLPRAFFLERRL